MQSHLIAILLATVAIGSCIANPNLISGPSRILEIMSATSEIQRNNPQLTVECFDYYNDVFKTEYSEYVDEYNLCVDKYDGGYEQVLEQYNSVVWDLSNSTFESCMFLLDCDKQNNSENALSCYSTEGPTYSKQLSNVAANASVSVSSLRQQVDTLVFTRDQCCSATSRNYEIRSGESYEDLQKCLSGENPVPERSTTTTSSSSSSSTSTTAANPTTTTTTPSPSTTTSSSSTSSTTRSPSTVAHFSSVENSSGNSQHRFPRRLDNIFKHIL
uniref:CG10912 protein n=1 Tax=Drosophila melanogaster TaxID=7227 RepID=E1UI89_DROME|nr:CG10912 protein [Drosophila melanogaster]